MAHRLLQLYEQKGCYLTAREWLSMLTVPLAAGVRETASVLPPTLIEPVDVTASFWPSARVWADVEELPMVVVWA